MPRNTAPASAAPLSAVAVAACAFALPVRTMGAGPVLLQITPAGEFVPSDGRDMDSPPWRVTAAGAQRLIDRFEARKQPAVIDYEHQTLHKEKNGQPAPAAGWMRALRWRDGEGLYAVVDLTQRARDLVAAGEYLYFSPVFEYSRKTGDVLDVHMGALTNNPAIHGMAPVTLAAAACAQFLSRSPSPQEPLVNPLLKALLASLGLPATTPEDAAIAALSALGPLSDVAASRAVAAAACTALQLPANAPADAVTAACSSLRGTRAAEPDPARFVPIAVVEELRTGMAALTALHAQGQIDKAVGDALADGRLLPAMESWARGLGKTNMAALTSYLAAAQPIAALTASQTGGKPPAMGDGQGFGLSADEVAVATATGLTPEQFAKAKAAA